ncbi:hypothetical protein [[Ruminococcus] lactaris]|uniref:Uncharacterized protein n=1 Tax=[Ruminococcus] lactaris TaxID=46228 RepID=A0A414P847_9FIRM|nr:hypothetical protein [[Ruminococcus] lactaris]RHF62313.1 hypothetical protein DW672_03470 [[Ruminococcus] lactaris]
MSRAEMRRLQREQKKSETVTYNLTKAQLDAMVNKKFRDELSRVKKEATEDAVRTAMTLMLTLPLEVLIDHYWQKSYADRIPKFTAYVIDYYKKWESGELDMDKLQADLWERGRVKIVEE